MGIEANLLSRYPKNIHVTDGLTKTEANGIITLGFDYVGTEFGAELQQAVDSATNSAATATTKASEAAASAITAVDAKDDTLAALASAGLPLLAAGDAGFYLRIKNDLSGYEKVHKSEISQNAINILSVLTPSERTDVLSGTNAIDITSKIAAVIASAPSGSVVDATSLNGIVTWTADVFGGAHTKAIRFITGRVTIRANFNSFSFILPSLLTWEGRGTRIEPSVPITSIPNATGGLGFMVDTFMGGSGRTCSGSGSTIVVSNVDGIRVGTTIAIYGAFRDFSNQFTLGSNITNATTSIPISGSTAGTIDPGIIYLRIGGSEFVRGLFGGGVLDTTYPGGGRGLLGTAAANHTAGDAVLLMQSLVRTVVDISGTTLTIDEPVEFTFSNAEFRFGTVETRVTGEFEIDGLDDKSVPVSSSWSCLGATLSSKFKVDGRIRLKGAVTGGYLFMGTVDLKADIDAIDRCGRPSPSKLGASGWLFGANKRPNIRVRETSNGNISNAVDNKSSGIISTGLWTPNHDFNVRHETILTHLAGHDVTASFDGYCWSGYADCSESVASIGNGLPQQSLAIEPTGVTIEVAGMKSFIAPTGSSYAGNTVILGGRKERIIDASLVLGAPLACGANADTTALFGVTGAKPGDRISIQAGQTPAGVVLTNWYVSATNQVTLVFRNTTGGTLNVIAQTFLASVRGPW